MLYNMFSFVNDTDNYEARKIGRDTSESGIEVSTAYTSDEGYETALMDSHGVHPVERYGTRGQAEIGHKKWIVFANSANGKKVMKLGGIGEFVRPEEIMLEASPGREN